MFRVFYKGIYDCGIANNYEDACKKICDRYPNYDPDEVYLAPLWEDD